MAFYDYRPIPLRPEDEEQAPAIDPAAQAAAKTAVPQDYIPRPQAHEQLDPALIRDALDRAARFSIVKQAVGTHAPNWFEVKQGKGPTQMPTPGLDAVEHQQNEPLRAAQADLAHRNDTADLLNKWQAANGKLKFDGEKAAMKATLEKYKADQSLEGRKYGADAGLEGKKYAVDHRPPPKPAMDDEKEAAKEWPQFVKQTDEYNGRSNTLRTMRDQVIAGKKLLTMISDGKGGYINATPQQMTEAARLLDRVLAQGGQVSEGITRDLTPHTKGRKLAEILQWIKDVPQGTDQQEFLRQMGDTVARESKVAEDVIKKGKQTALTGIPHVLKSKNRRNDVINRLKGVGLDPDEFDLDTGLLREAAQAAAQEQPKAGFDPNAFKNKLKGGR